MGLQDENDELKRRLAAAEALVAEEAGFDAGLREHEARHRLLIENWTQAVWETDAAGAVVADSPSWRAYTGQTLGEWLGYGWLDAVHPDDRAFAERQWRHAMAARALVDAEFRLRAPDGGWRWTNVRAAPVLDPDGTIGKWVGVNIDIDARRRTEEALRESEGRLYLALEATSLAVYEWDLVSDHLTTNERFRELVGIAPGEPVLGSIAMKHWMHPDDRARVDPDLSRAMDSSGAGKFAFDHRLSRVGPLGHPWVLNHGQVYFDGPAEARQPVRIFGTLQDITPRKQAEIAAREAAERQTFLLRLSDTFRAEGHEDAIGILSTRMVAEHFKVDRSYICRYAQEEGLVRIGPEYRAPDLPALTGEYRPADLPGTMRWLESGPLVIRDLLGDTTLSQADKRSMVETLGLRGMLAGVLRKGENNAIWCLVAATTRPRDWSVGELTFLEDVAERTWAAMERARHEHDLRGSEDRFQQFAKASAAGMWIRDARTFEMEYVSPAIARIYGVEPEGILDGLQHWAGLILPEDRDVALRHLEEARRGEAIVHEFRIQRPSDGTFRWIRSTEFPLFNAQGQVQRIGGLAEDVTDAKLAIEHQGILLAELQHRVRNIMTIIRSIAARSGERAGSVRDYADVLAGRLLALSRVQALLTRAANVSVSLRAIVLDEISVQAQHGDQYDIDGPDVDISPKAAEVLTLAIHELSTNAAKYGALSVPHGKVQVRWAVADRNGSPWLAFDWLEGGTPERPPSEPDKPRRKGFGTELIEGRIPYELRGRGTLAVEPGGARCHLEFPLRNGPSILETGAPRRVTVFGGALDLAGEANLGGRRVMVVEDDYYLATDAARALAGAGATVLGPCASEAEARAALEEQRPDAVLLDIDLGPGPIFKLAEILRDRGLPFVFITGYDQHVIPGEFAGIGRLEKPVQFRRMVGAVAELLPSGA